MEEQTLFGFQSWRHLLFLHWPVSPALLNPLLPPALELDLYEGKVFVGIIPFQVVRARTLYSPDWLGLTFLETNVRTYVRLGGKEAGVYFFSLDAASLLAVLGARLKFGLPYYFSRMRMSREATRVDYEMKRISRRRPFLDLSYETGEVLDPSDPGSLQHFLVERYRLYVHWGKKIYSAQVQHEPYRLQEARVLRLDQNLTEAAGISVSPGPPPLVHYSPGVDVSVTKKSSITGT